jgi:metallo-beta-lactamase class B
LFNVRERDRELKVVLICGLSPPPALSLGEYPEIRSDFEKSFKRLRSLKADIFLTPHARDFGRWPKYQKSLKAKNPVDAFIDPEGYKKYIDEAEQRYRNAIAE